MKLLICLLASLLGDTAASIGQIAAAGNSKPTFPDHFPAEAVQLKRDYEQSLGQATKPIQDQYIADLKQLLEEETNEGNKPQADAIKQELDGLPGGSGISGDTIAEFESQLVAVGWIWNGVQHMSFDWGGKAREMDIHWKSVAPYTIEYKGPGGNSGTIIFDRAMQNGSIKELTPGGIERTLTLARAKN